MRLIIVSNRLPVTVTIKDGKFCYSDSMGGLATGLNTYLNSTINEKSTAEYLWIGWPGICIDKVQEPGLKIALAAKYNCHPVFLDKEEIEGFYEGFCNKTIWPLFHYFSAKAQFNKSFWNQYKRVNDLFALKVKEIIREGDIIWVHDYHLMLLPQLIRQFYSNASIGYFLHIPFPSYEMFRLLAKTWSIDLLHGILGADLIGFHTIDYLQHFKHCLVKGLGLECESNKVFLESRIVRMNCFPMNIDFDYFSDTANTTANKNKSAELKKYFNNNKLILSIDRLDYTKGIVNRLLAFESLLEKFPEWLNRVNLLLIVVPSRAEVEDYQNMKVEIDCLVGKINGRFSNTKWLPISYQYRCFNSEELITLYSSCDIALITPLRDGMNLIAKEYVASQPDHTGVLILSEIAGASQELLEAELVNPYHTNEITLALSNVLNYKKEDCIIKNVQMQRRLKAYDIVKWVEEFLDEVVKVRAENISLNTKVLTSGDVEIICDKFITARERLILLDYDGTLVPFEKFPGLAIPSAELLTSLKNLSEIKDTQVVIISGRDRGFLKEWFGDLNIDFAAESGYWIRKNREWRLAEHSDIGWKEIVKSILKKYINKLPGSFIEEKEFTLVWHFRNSDLKLSEIRTLELIDEFENTFGILNINITKGIKSLEISAQNITKKSALINWIKKEYGFICSIGDDASDELIFEKLPPNAFTIKVGLNETSAKYIVKDSSQVVALIEHLVLKSQCFVVN
jgi:trehalose 6-phosphate synthase/phosphatase